MDWQAGRGCLRDAFATPARQLRAHVPGDAERPRQIFQHFGDIFAERAQRAAAFGAGARGGMLHHFARQRLGYRLAGGFATACHGIGRGGFLRSGRRNLRHLFFELAPHDFELFERAAQLFRRGTEPFA